MVTAEGRASSKALNGSVLLRRDQWAGLGVGSQGTEVAGAVWSWSRCREHLAMPQGGQSVEDFEGGAHLDFGLEGLSGCQGDSRFRGGRVETSCGGEERKGG